MNDTKQLLQEEEPRIRIMGVRLPEDTFDLIESTIMPFYRTNTMSHAIKLLLEDAAAMISASKWAQPTTLQSLNDPRDSR